MTIYTILANENDRRIRIVPTKTDEGWTYQVTELDGVPLDDEAQFAPTKTQAECEWNIRVIFGTDAWDLKPER